MSNSDTFENNIPVVFKKLALRILLLVVVVVTAYCAFLWVREINAPPVPHMTSTYELSYLPKNYVFAESVTNVISEQTLLTGSAGVGAPQANWSNQTYKEKGADNHENILVFNLDKSVSSTYLVDLRAVDTLDAYFLDDGRVHHTQLLSVETPTWNVGKFKVVDWRIEQNTLTIEREAEYDVDSLVYTVILFIIFFLFLTIWTQTKVYKFIIQKLGLRKN